MKWEYQKKREINRRNMWDNNNWKFPQINVRLQEAQRMPSWINTKNKQTKIFHLVISFSNYRKSKITRKSWKKPEPYLKRNKEDNNYIQLLRSHASKKKSDLNYLVLREKNTNSEICTLWNDPSKMKGNNFLGKQKLKEFVASRPALHEMFKEILQRERKIYRSPMGSI